MTGTLPEGGVCPVAFMCHKSGTLLLLFLMGLFSEVLGAGNKWKGSSTHCEHAMKVLVVQVFPDGLG